MGDAGVAAVGQSARPDLGVSTKLDDSVRSAKRSSESRRDSLNPLSGFSEVRREDILRHVFGDVGDLLDDFSCAVESTVLLHGRMYVTTRFLCFYSNLFGLEKKIRIPYTHITAVSKENTALVIPNAIAITTIRKEYVFRSFWDRDECFRMLKEHIKGMARKHTGVKNRDVNVHGYSVKMDDTQDESPGQSATASLFQDTGSVGAFEDDEEGEGGRLRARSDGMSGRSEVSAVSSMEFEPSTPGSSTHSASPTNKQPRSRQRASTAGHVDSSPVRDGSSKGSPRARSASAALGADAGEESPSSSADEYDFMDGSDDENEQDDDIVEETAWTDKGKDTSATNVTSQEDGTGEFTQDQVAQEIVRASLKMPVLKEVLPISVQDFATMFVEDPAEHSWKKYHAKMGDSQLDVTNWSNMRAVEHENLGSGREIKFFKPVNLPGLKETRGVKLQKYQRFGAEGLIVHSSTRLEDVPAADTFTVEDVVAVRKPTTEECDGDINAHAMVEISFEVRFIKSTFLKYMIESNTNTEMKKWLLNFFNHIKGIVNDSLCKAEEKLDGIKKILDKHADEGEEEGEGTKVTARASIRRLSLKVTEAHVGVRAHMVEALESWQRVEGRRFFVVCFALLLTVTFTMYWQLRHLQSSMDHLHDNVVSLSEELAAVKALLDAKKGR